MICSPYQCLFVHVPKAAGRSVEQVFLKLVGLSWETRGPLLLRANDDPRCGPPRLAHLKASEYVSCGYLTSQQFESYFRFSFVRNPWDRIVSEYKYRGYPLRIDFKTYLFKHLPAPGWTDAYRHIIPQCEFIFDDAGKLLVNFVGRFEALQADFDTVCTRLGISHTTLPHDNRALKEAAPNTAGTYLTRLRRLLSRKVARHTFPHYTEYYDDEAREFVARLYSRDIETFNYAFGAENRAPSTP
jgi:hypothetical protein